MNYTEIEAKVREATNDEAWGPTGGFLKLYFISLIYCKFIFCKATLCKKLPNLRLPTNNSLK